MHHSYPIVLSSIIASLLTGCVGYNTALFSTKSTVGVDFDTKPPTLDIALARREGAVLPAYASGHPPVVASFIHDKGAQIPFFPRVSTTFAGGKAAAMITRLFDAPDEAVNSNNGKLDDTRLPLPDDIKDTRLLGIFIVRNRRADEVHPFFFGTDTTVGLKIAWTGTTGASGFPDSAKFGFHRKELAIAPVYVVQDKNGNYYAVMGSFLATQDTNANVEKVVGGASVGHIQYFATGKAAENLARRHDVRVAMVKRLDPSAAKAAGLFESTPDSTIPLPP